MQASLILAVCYGMVVAISVDALPLSSAEQIDDNSPSILRKTRQYPSGFGGGSYGASAPGSGSYGFGGGGSHIPTYVSPIITTGRGAGDGFDTVGMSPFTGYSFPGSTGGTFGPAMNGAGPSPLGGGASLGGMGASSLGGFQSSYGKSFPFGGAQLGGSSAGGGGGGLMMMPLLSMAAGSGGNSNYGGGSGGYAFMHR